MSNIAERNRLRVLHLVPNFSGGGAEKQLSWLAASLQDLGIDVHLAYLREGANFGLARASSATFHRIPSCSNHDPTILLRLLALIHRLRPNIVQTWILNMDVFGGLAARMSGVPFVLSERSSALMYPVSWKVRLRDWVGRGADAVVANSQGGMEYWRPRTKASLHVIQNGLPMDQIRDVRPIEPGTLGLPGDAQLIVSAGRLSPEKNLPLLLDALDQVLPSHPKAIALLFGEGPLRRDVEERIRRSRHANQYRLPGFTHDLWRWIRSAKVVVSASLLEGNPNVILEAMAIGCPLIVSDIPQHREILDESMAMFCPTDSAPRFAAAIEQTLSNMAEAKARAAASQERSHAWSLDETARKYVHLYRSLAAQNGAAGGSFNR